MTVALLGLLAGQAVAQVDMSSIEVPFEAMPHLQAYSACIDQASNANPDRNSHDADTLRAVNAAAISACAAVRQDKLGASIAAIKAKGGCVWPEKRTESQCIEMTKKAFQRLDNDFEFVPINPPYSKP